MKLLAFLLCTASALLAQGPLAPPGAPAPTMKTLDQVEARTPLAGGTSTRTISASGSYYLTGNINIADGSDAIVIAASNVTLDLNGFALVSTSSPAAGTGVLISGLRNNVAIINGNISGSVAYVGGGGDQFTGPGFAHGIRVDNDVNGARVSQVTVSGCDQGGIGLSMSNGVVTDCAVAFVGSSGIVASVVNNSTVQLCGGLGITGYNISNCHAVTVGNDDAIRAVSAANNCYGIAALTGRGVAAKVAINCHGSTSTGARGLDAETATGCSAFAGPGTALNAINATNCRGVSQSGTGLSAEIADHCYGSSDNGIGLSATYLATGCFGKSVFGSVGLSVSGNACYCSGARPGGTAISCAVAIGCNTFGGSVTATQGKFLGTP